MASFCCRGSGGWVQGCSLLAMAATTAASLAETQSKVDNPTTVTLKSEYEGESKSVASSSKNTGSKGTAKSVKSNIPHLKEGDIKDTNDIGWNTVKSKSEKYENRFSNNHGQTNDNIDRYRGFPRRRPPFRGYPRKMNRTKEPMRSSGSGNKEFVSNPFNNPELNGGAVDSHSSGESGDSDGKKSEDNENKSKPEYVAAPMPKTNAWGKANPKKNEKSDTNTPASIPASLKQKQSADDKSVPSLSKTTRLPTNSAWGKVNNKTDVDMAKEEKADKEQHQQQHAGSGINI